MKENGFKRFYTLGLFFLNWDLSFGHLGADQHSSEWDVKTTGCALMDENAFINHENDLFSPLIDRDQIVGKKLYIPGNQHNLTESIWLQAMKIYRHCQKIFDVLLHHGKSETDPFKLRSGIFQNCQFSLCFNVVINGVMKCPEAFRNVHI